MRRAAIVKIVASAVTLATALAAPVHSQGLGKKVGGMAYPVDDQPKVDEKAYKSALDRIPDSSKKYDPWGVARSPESASPSKKSN